MMPTIRPAEHRRRRAALMSMMTPGTIAVVPAAPVRLRNRDTEYPFRQDSDFLYLTGFAEPDAVLVLAPGREHGETILFCRERDPRAELYHGERLGPERAARALGLDDAFPVTDLDDILPGMLEGRERIYLTLGEHADFDNRVLHWVNSIRAREAGGAVPPGEFVALKHLLHEQRLYKSAAEVRIMREAARITCAAHRRAMSACRAGNDRAGPRGGAAARVPVQRRPRARLSQHRRRRRERLRAALHRQQPTCSRLVIWCWSTPVVSSSITRPT